MIEGSGFRTKRGVGQGAARLAAVAMLALATWLLVASSASAIVVHVKGRALSYQPLPRTSLVQALPTASKRKPRLEYFGGPIMTSNTNYALYWEPAGYTPAYPSGYQGGVSQFFEALAHDSGGVQNTDSVLVQYTNSLNEPAKYASSFAGVLADTDPYPKSGCEAAPICLTDEQIQAEISKYVEAHKLPMDLAHEYFLLTPPDVESCFEPEGRSCSAGAEHAEYCAYHGAINVAGKTIVYSNDPYEPECGTGNYPSGPGDLALQSGLVHEHSESVTDPELNAWKAKNGEEIGDLCRTLEPLSEFGEPLGTAPDGAKYNQVINGHDYWYQQEWSNEAAGCAQRAGVAPVVTKLAPKAGPLGGGTPVIVTGKGFVGTVTVSFGSVAAAKVEVKSSTSLSATSPAASKGAVNVTVKTSEGTSPVTSKDRFRFKA